MVAIHFNMPLEVVPKAFDFGTLVLNGINQPGEHFGNHIFTPMKEGRSDFVGASLKSGVQRKADKLPRLGQDRGSIQCRLPGDSGTNLRDEFINGSAFGTDLAHRFTVKFKMTQVAPAPVFIGFLPDDDLQNKSGGFGICCGSPWDLVAGHNLLHALEQRHEVPDGEGVFTHQDSQRRKVLHRQIDGMIKKLPSQLR